VRVVYRLVGVKAHGKTYEFLGYFDDTSARVENDSDLRSQCGSALDRLAHLEFGGRGVRNAVEAMFTNPLARALLQHPSGSRTAKVSALVRSNDGWTATLE